MSAPVHALPGVRMTRHGAPHRRDQAKAKTRAQILDAARFLFSHVGFFETSIRDVAARSERTIGAIFANVEHKDQLWREAMGGPAPSTDLAYEVAMVLAERPGFDWLLRKQGETYIAALVSPGWSPCRADGVNAAGKGLCPASALRAARVEASRLLGEAGNPAAFAQPIQAGGRA